MHVPACSLCVACAHVHLRLRSDPFWMQAPLLARVITELALPSPRNSTAPNGRSTSQPGSQLFAADVRKGKRRFATSAREWTKLRPVWMKSTHDSGAMKPGSSAWRPPTALFCGVLNRFGPSLLPWIQGILKVPRRLSSPLSFRKSVKRRALR